MEKRYCIKSFEIHTFLYILLGFFNVCYSATKKYENNYEDSVWSVEGSRLQCVLKHEVPTYGRLIFSKNAGSEERSDLEIWFGRSPTHYRGEVHFEAPEWNKNMPTKEGWKFAFPDHQESIIFSARQTRQLLEGLDQGLNVHFVHRDHTNYRDEIIGSASPILFNPSYLAYSRCQANLVPVSFEVIRNSNVYFSSGTSRLDQEAKEWLEYVLIYIKDGPVDRVELIGYTDSVGTFRDNHRLAGERVEKIKGYLIRHGVSKDAIQSKVHGMQKPVASNLDPHGRHLNRRVSIRLSR